MSLYSATAIEGPDPSFMAESHDRLHSLAATMAHLKSYFAAPD